MIPSHWRSRLAVPVAASITVFIALADTVALRLHGRGWGQSILGYVDAASAVLQVPGFAVVHYTGLRDGHHTTTAVWFILVVLNFALWVIALRWLLHWVIPGPKSGSPSTDRRRTASPVSRRRFLTTSARIAAAGTVGLTCYSMFGESRWFGITRRVHLLPSLPSELDGLRVVQLTDIHHGPNLSLSYVRQVVAAANALNADLVLLTGDYVHRSAIYIAPVVREMTALRAKMGVVGVLGNHDWWEDAPLTKRCFAQASIPIIDNGRMFVTRDRRLVPDADDGLCVAGVGDFLEDVQDYDTALGGLPNDMPRILLSHNPDVAEDTRLLHSGHRVDLMISGHTHGGQVRLPLLGTPIVPSRYGQKYASGLVQGPKFPVYVSRGIGMTILPLRFCVPPEIALTEFRRS